MAGNFPPPPGAPARRAPRAPAAPRALSSPAPARAPVESPPAEPLLAELADQFVAAERLLGAQIATLDAEITATPDARFGGPVDSPDTLVQLADVAAALVRELEAVLPRIASNAC